MKHQFRIIILGENEIRLLSKILILLNRKNLKINYVSASSHDSMENSKYVIDLECIDYKLIQLKKLIEKLIGITHVYFYNIKENYRKKIDLSLAIF
ncbi:acetolactate synthase [Blattabacterium cuenoti]|uniref:acetolactate synthase n=1 Tax=Blattabacterium cuenoti TaxID=1653831 RepID=UPI00163C51B8|nr:acetolactate synthase [Blattabacterium cuenoti]